MKTLRKHVEFRGEDPPAPAPLRVLLPRPRRKRGVAEAHTWRQLLCAVLSASVTLAITLAVVSRLHVAEPMNAMRKWRLMNRLTFHDALCHAREHTDAAGEVAPGAPPGTLHVVHSAHDCCRRCRGHAGCDTWVFNDASRECWLKKQGNAFPENPVIYADPTGSSLWTSGAIYSVPSSKKAPGCIHTVSSWDGDATRLYASFKRLGEDDGTFVQLSNTSNADVPTYVSRNASFEDALLEFLESPRSVACGHVLVVDPQTIFVKRIARDWLYADLFIGYKYEFVTPDWPAQSNVTRRYVMHPHMVPHTSLFPSLCSVGALKTALLAHRRIRALFEEDAEAREAFGVALDMYAFSLALAATRTSVFTPLAPFNPIGVRLGAADALGDAALIHYGELVSVHDDQLPAWRLGEGAPLRRYRKGMRFGDNSSVSKGAHELLETFLFVYNQSV